MENNYIWFKEKINLQLNNNYDIQTSFFKNGDLGDLDRLELEGKDLGATIEFWSSGWLGIHLIDYRNDGSEIVNILLEPDQKLQKQEELENLFSILLHRR